MSNPFTLPTPETNQAAPASKFYANCGNSVSEHTVSSTPNPFTAIPMAMNIDEPVANIPRKSLKPLHIIGIVFLALLLIGGLIGWSQMSPALHKAAAANDLASVKRLVSYGVNVNT